MTVIRHTILFSFLLICSTDLAHAQEPADVHPYLSEKFFADLGIFFPDRRIKLSANGSSGEINELIDFHEEFGLSESDETFALDLGWRFGKKWMLVGQYFDSSGGSRWVLDEDIEWEDVVFQMGTEAFVGFDFSVTRLFFGRTLATSHPHEFGLGAGLHWLETSTIIGGTIISGGGTARAIETARSEQLLPNIGTWYKYSITPRWIIRSRLDWLDAEIDKYDGQLINFSVGINYKLTEHFGIGLNYHDFELDVVIDETDWRGRIFTAYQGMYVYLSAYW